MKPISKKDCLDFYNRTISILRKYHAKRTHHYQYTFETTLGTTHAWVYEVNQFSFLINIRFDNVELAKEHVYCDPLGGWYYINNEDKEETLRRFSDFLAMLSVGSSYMNKVV